MKPLLAFLIAQAVALPQPQYLHVAVENKDTAQFVFDSSARAALIVETPTGFRVIVLRRNGQHVPFDFTQEEVAVTASKK